jgi:hypothetical protein
MKRFLLFLTASLCAVVSVVTLLPNKSSAANWYEGPYLIINTGTQMCMGVENSYATWTYTAQYDCNGYSQYQHFVYADSGVKDQYGNRTFTIRPYHALSQCISIETMSTLDGTPARLYPCHQAGTNQFFSLFHLNAGFGLRALSSNKYLQPNGGTSTPGARITQWHWSIDYPHELWANSLY